MKKLVVEDKDHSKLSPSSSSRWMVCSGSVRLIDSLPYEVEKPKRYTSEGTVAHTIHEWCLTQNTNAEDYIGTIIEQGGFEFTVDDEMVEAVQESVDYIRDRLKSSDYHQAELLVEVKYPLTSLGVPGLDGGTSDAILIYRDEDHEIEAIEVIDYKHGQGVSVEPEMNSQLLQYALGVCLYFKYEWGTTVTLTVAQPRAWHPLSTIRSYSLTMKELIEWQDKELIPRAEATLEPDAPLVPSDKGCMFCKAKGICPALYNRTQEVAMVDFKDLSKPLSGLPSVESLSSEQKLFIMDNSAAIKEFLSGVEEQVTNEIESGSKDYTSRFKLVRGRGSRKLTPVAFDEITSPLFDILSDDDLYVKKQKSMTDIEKTLKKKLGKKEADKIMESITDKEEGRITLVTIDDKRKEVEPSATSDFSGLEDKQ